jgi:hypothetical protein
MTDFANGSMNALRAFVCGAVAAALVGLTPIGASAQQFPPLDRRLMFDPSPLDENPTGADASRQQTMSQRADQTNGQAWSANAFVAPDIDLDRSPGQGHTMGGGLGSSGTAVEPNTAATPALGLRGTLGAFSLNIETERAATAYSRLSDDTTTQETPFGQKPRRRFVPFIGLAAKSPLY